ncbi:EnvZ/OmpR regulon moderator MzrA [Leclercia barmai]|uniref:EnvZ/OmpR regulon moderator MzrA n=1 Tax=Leclercia barmai TaxID=2785629 RepID=UPI003BB92050
MEVRANVIASSNASLRRLSYAMIALVMFSALLLAWSALQKQESTLAIRAVSQGVSMPDGFSIWHHLDANGIQFKSITPQNDVLLITFDSSVESAAAKKVLDRSLPHGYIIAQQDDNSQTAAWLTRLRDTSRLLG